MASCTNIGLNISNSNGSIFSVANDGSTYINGNLVVATMTNTAAGYHSLLVDASGRLAAGGGVSSTLSTGWNIGGNSSVGGAVGTLGTTDNEDLILVAGGGGTGTERMRISNIDGAVKITSSSSSNDQANSPFKIVSTTTSFAKGTDFRLFEVKSSGTVYAREFYVQTSLFPDYVFDKKYKLLPIVEFENYLAKK